MALEPTTGLASALDIREPATNIGSAFLRSRSIVDDFSDLWDRYERVSVPLAHVRQSDVWPMVRELPVESEGVLQAIARIHPETYIAELMRDRVQYESAVAACAAVLTVGRAVARGNVGNGYALVRPAGHHASASIKGGGGSGCVLANGAVLARELQAMGFPRIAIVDWDAHHGNGAQDIFWQDGSVMTISLHQGREVWSPYDGSIEATGAGPGINQNVNLPFEPGAGGAAFQLAMTSVVAPLCARFAPNFIIVSCGFDGSNVDPAGRLQLCAADYFEMTRTMMDIADAYCNGRIVMLHEGGYAVSYVAICLESVLRALSGGEAAPDPFAERWGPNFAGPPRSSDLNLINGLVERHVRSKVK